jgi:mannose-1-phosphate guanylyltransferase
MSTWALVLAGGEGRRLEQLTTESSGRQTPKQFCSLAGGMSLLEETLQRATSVCDPAHVCAVVTERHRQWWTPNLRGLRADNIIVQPTGRGTAHGIMLPVLHILARDPEATILVLPSDHYVHDEEVLRRAMRSAIARAKLRTQQIYLLGIQPDEADTELGYIVAKLPLIGRCGPVSQFVEKPSAWGDISRLRLQGALWNSFIFAASGAGLISLFPEKFSATIESMRMAVEQDRRTGTCWATSALYRTLPSMDFSRDVLTGQESSLQLISVPSCGWSDLGTPGRLERTLRRLERQPRAVSKSDHVAAPLILREQFERLVVGTRSNVQIQ